MRMTFHRLLLSAVFVILIAGNAAADPWWVFFRIPDGWSPGDDVARVNIDAVAEAGYRVRTVSRYFNAVSVEADMAPDGLVGLACVARIEPVKCFTGTRLPVATPDHAAPKRVTTAEDTVHDLTYGISFAPLNALGIPELHDRGLTGAGVIVGVLDSGFDNTATTAATADLHITHTRDFVDGGSNVSGDTHGTQVLGCLAGKHDGEYYGAAFGATFLLARTDETATETRADEDRWVAGVEWCDSLGADLISSSLVYNEFDTIEESYSKDQMDGKTSLVAQAAEIAWSRGILVINSAGNEGGNHWNIVTTPADAEHVLAVGSLVINGDDFFRASSSSVGPTADGRIKPDIAAPGSWIYAPYPGTDRYSVVSGTSFAAPFVSGLCALLLEAHPGWTPAMLPDIIKTTARDLGESGPDNETGWGIPNATTALEYTPVAVGEPYCPEQAAPVTFALGAPHPNPFNGAVSIPFTLNRPAAVTLTIRDITGRHVTDLAGGAFTAGVHNVAWQPRNAASGVYIATVTSGTSQASAKILYLR